MASDGQKVYIVPNAGDVIVYDIPGNQVSFRSLTGNPHALAASLAPDGQTLYVSADDSQVHIINTVSGGDLTQVPVPSSSLCMVTTGGPSPKCLPDLLEVRP
jgi:outer membrane protein assembly factor BamB